MVPGGLSHAAEGLAGRGLYIPQTWGRNAGRASWLPASFSQRGGRRPCGAARTPLISSWQKVGGGGVRCEVEQPLGSRPGHSTAHLGDGAGAGGNFTSSSQRGRACETRSNLLPPHPPVATPPRAPPVATPGGAARNASRSRAWGTKAKGRGSAGACLVGSELTSRMEAALGAGGRLVGGGETFQHILACGLRQRWREQWEGSPHPGLAQELISALPFLLHFTHWHGTRPPVPQGAQAAWLRPGGGALPFEMALSCVGGGRPGTGRARPVIAARALSLSHGR